ncbi:MAG TPA: TIGR02147 family protein [Bdellovibrionales bacterium]|nr:TIGR02147 family protein [Bdellovibrionales bacterium]
MKPDLFKYDDYRLFLKDQCAYLKGQVAGFNYTMLAQQAGVSKTLLTLVMRGERRLTARAIDKILPLLKLTAKEQKYFRLLCRFTDAADQAEKSAALAELSRLSGFQKHHPKESEAFQYLSKWFYVAIRELTADPEFKLSAEWIQKKLVKPVPLLEIEAAIEFLKRTGFIEVLPDGRVLPPNKEIDCMADVYKTSLLKFYNEVFSLALEQLPRIEPERKHLVGHTVALSNEKFQEVRQILDKALQDVIALASEDSKPETVFQVSLLGFPMTAARGGES